MFWEIEIIKYLQSLNAPFFIKIASFFTMFGEEFFLILLLSLFYFGYNKKKGKYLIINLLFTLLMGPLIKNIIKRPRPYMQDNNIKCLKKVQNNASLDDISSQGYSFFSMHSANIMVVSFAINKLYNKKYLKIILLLITFLVGLSRIYLGVHFPSDVFFGWFVGVIIFYFLNKLNSKNINFLKYTIFFFLLGSFGWFYATSNDFYTIYGLGLGTLLGFYLEEKYINFSNTKNLLNILLRLIGASIIFIIINTFLKYIFITSSSLLLNHFFRTLRYFLISFILVFLYPSTFKYIDYLFNNKKNKL